jgi:hypothetical protein
MVFASNPDIYKVFGNIHMIRMGTLIMPHPPYLFISKLQSWGGPDIYKVFGNIHMIRMGTLIMPHPPYLFISKLQSWGGILLGHTWATNDVMVHWLWSQTHMEWFSNLHQTYPRCLKKFMSHWWADGSTIMPHPAYLFVSNLGSWRDSWVTHGLQVMSWCIGWGPRPTWNECHAPSKHIQGVSKHSYSINW